MPSFADHFSTRATAYAAFRPDYPAALFDWLATLVSARRLAWDCATGSGQAAVPLAERFDRVVATDASAAQVARARPHPRIDYGVAPAERSGLADESADLVTVGQALHWFDLPAFYAEVQRVLVPEGMLAVWSYGDPVLPDAPALDRALRDFNLVTLAPWWPPERALVGEGYRELPFPFAEVDSPALELERRWTRAELLGYLHSWSAVGRWIAAEQGDPVGLAEGALIEAGWRDDERVRVVWPLTIRAGRWRGASA